MKKFLILVTAPLLLFVYTCRGQELPDDFREMSINKKVKEYEDIFDLTSPLSSYLTITYLRINGNVITLGEASSQKIKYDFPKANVPEVEVSQKEKEHLLNTTIEKILVYKDSVAGVITDDNLIRWLSFENGQWLNAGEGYGRDDA